MDIITVPDSSPVRIWRLPIFKPLRVTLVNANCVVPPSSLPQELYCEVVLRNPVTRHICPYHNVTIFRRALERERG